VVLMQKSALRGLKVDEEENLALAAYDLDTGALRVPVRSSTARARSFPRLTCSARRDRGEWPTVLDDQGYGQHPLRR
jgi:hypothetical protein